MARKKKHAGPRIVQVPLQHRMTSTYYSSEECELAIQGTKIPPALGHDVVQACVVRGIRLHPHFATELRGTLPIFTRALNAHQIMSDVLPDMTQLEEFPYCIWHPNVAKEDTYERLVRRYPQMRYQVGRACAVAGYTALYRDLRLLPDVHIAEDALDNGSEEIFRDIMAHRDKFSIMDDYRLIVDNDTITHHPTCLNGDTAVRSTLDVKRKFDQDKYGRWVRSKDIYFNITEDLSFDTIDYIPSNVTSARRLAVRHLYTPLPADLPLLQKDILILMAAYNGDVDRYSRLMRANWTLRGEYGCVIRGIYHSTFFAKWWSIRLGNQDERFEVSLIEEAVTARAIMDNDLSRINSKIPPPYCIWYPIVPRQSTLKLLVARRPDITHQIARAAIVGNYQELYDSLSPDPHFALLAEAKDNANRHFIEDQESKIAQAAATGVGWDQGADSLGGWKRYTKDDTFEAKSGILYDEIGASNVQVDFDWLYNGINANIDDIELHVSAASNAKEEIPNGRTAFGDRINEELAEEGIVNLSFEYEEEAKRLGNWDATGTNAR